MGRSLFFGSIDNCKRRKCDIYIGVRLAAKQLGISPSTLIRMEKKGIACPFKNHAGWRGYTNLEIEKIKKSIGPIVTR